MNVTNHLKLVIFLVFISSFNTAQKSTSKQIADRRTKSEKITIHDIKQQLFLNNVQEIVGIKEITYDRDGNKIEELTRAENGMVSNRTVYKYKYDSVGDLIEESTEVSSDPKPLLKMATPIYKYEYDLEGNVSEKLEYRSVSVSRKWVYDSTGQKVQKLEYGPLIMMGKWTYDSNGNLIDYTMYNTDGSLGRRSVGQYDLGGHKREVSVYKHDGSLMSKHIFGYDSSGNNIEKLDYDSKGRLKGRTVYEYDARGNMISQSPYLYVDKYFGERLGTWYDLITLEYDSKNRVLNEKLYVFKTSIFGKKRILKKKLTHEYTEY